VNGVLDIISWEALPDQPKCGDCHGLPDQEYHISDSDNCRLCHPDSYKPSGELDFSKHMDGKIEISKWDGSVGQPKCGDCHGIPPQISGHLNAAKCSLCHTSDFGLHLNGKVEVIKWDPETSSIQCGECHGIPPKDGHPQSSECIACHKTYLTSDGKINQDVHMNGTINF
jgi:hypothetical protein